MPANITAAETCCGSQCRTAQMKEMKTPKGALRCFFFFFKSTWLLLLLFFSPSSSTPVLFALWAYFTSRLARKKKGNSRTPETSAHPAPLSTPSIYCINFSIEKSRRD